MGKSQETWNKKEREKKKQKSKQDKEEKKQERRDNASGGKRFEDMLAYVDENGNILSTPPDPSRRVEIKAEDIEIGVPKQRPIDPADLIRKGTVTFFNEAKGFGFIKDLQTQESVFVHVNSTIDRIKENSKVTFEVEKGPKGANAVNVRVTG